MVAFDGHPGDPMATLEETEGLISPMVTDCNHAFHNGIEKFHSNGQDEFHKVVRDLEQRFSDWAGYLGVFAIGNGSLDHRLQSHPQYRDLIFLTLDMLNMNLLQYKFPVPSSLDTAAKKITVLVDSKESDKFSGAEVNLRITMLEGVKTSINELDRLAIHLRHASVSPLDARIKVFTSAKADEKSSYETMAILAVNALYSNASDMLRRLLIESMTERYMKLRYWRSHEDKLRLGHLRGHKFRTDMTDVRHQEAASNIEESPAHLYITESTPKSEEQKQSKGINDTSWLSETMASGIGPQDNRSEVGGEKNHQRPAGASTVLRSKATFPSPPRKKEGQAQKCQFCRKIFFEEQFADTLWWRSHVNSDLQPFVCISGACPERQTFASRREWKAHMKQDYESLSQEYSSDAAHIADQNLHVDRRTASTIDDSAYDCPLCCMPLELHQHRRIDVSRNLDSLTPHLDAPEPDLNEIYEGSETKNKKVRFERQSDEDSQSADREDTPGLKSNMETSDPESNLSLSTTRSLQLSHIADHMQYLSFLTARLSPEGCADGKVYVQLSSHASDSQQSTKTRSTMNEKFDFLETGDRTSLGNFQDTSEEERVVDLTGPAPSDPNIANFGTQLAAMNETHVTIDHHWNATEKWATESERPSGIEAFPSGPGDLPGQRPTRILVGCWSSNNAKLDQDKHAVYGILRTNDTFRIKVVRETMDGRFFDGNFPPGTGARWIGHEEVNFLDHIRDLNKSEIKEYVRVRQYQIDHWGETEDERVANEIKAVYEAKRRVFAEDFKAPKA